MCVIVLGFETSEYTLEFSVGVLKNLSSTFINVNSREYMYMAMIEDPVE